MMRQGSDHRDADPFQNISIQQTLLFGLRIHHNSGNRFFTEMLPTGCSIILA